MIINGSGFEDDNLPDPIIGRNRHTDEVTNTPSPIKQGQRAENSLLFGPSGAGKTTVARAAVRELRREALDVPNACVNYWRNYTRNAVLEHLSRELVGAAVPRSVSTSTLLKNHFLLDES